MSTIAMDALNTNSIIKPNVLKFVSPLNAILVIIGIYVLYHAAYGLPLHSSLQFLEPLRTLGFMIFRSERMMEYVLWIAAVLHIGETIYAQTLFNDRGITSGSIRLMWTLQVFLFGIGSLSLLRALPTKMKVQ
jgi:hypothetical protein